MSTDSSPNPPIPAPPAGGTSLVKLLPRILVLLTLTGLVVALCLGSGGIAISTQTGIVMNLPDGLDGFTGKEQPVSESERILLPEDTEFAKKLYTNADDMQVNAQIVLAGAEKRSIHRPEVCLPGQGWTIKSSETVPVPLRSGNDLTVTMLRIGRPITIGTETRELTSLFLYWFVGHETATPSHLVRIAKTNLDVLLHNTNHRWAYVIVSAPVLKGLRPGGKDEEETAQMLKEFIAELAPQIMKSEQTEAPPQA